MLSQNYRGNRFGSALLNLSGSNKTKYTKKASSTKNAKDLAKAKSVKILVVEDQSINQYVAKSLLEGEGYQVDIAENGQAALNLYQTNHYAAILMDLGLPDLPGTEVTRQIRALEQESGQHIPIIALTANGLNAKSECLAAGMDDFSVKPFELEVISPLLKTWIENSK